MESASSESPKEQLRILVVDDDVRLRNLLQRFLEDQGYAVRTVADAIQMDRTLARELFALIVLDFMLPGEDGLTICKRLREAGNNTPIIMLTARAAEDDRVAGLDAGADDYLSKPFSPKELLARIRAVLRRRAPEALDAVVEVNGLRLDPTTYRVTRRIEGEGTEAREAKMGPTEFRLLHFFMSHPERVHSRAQLLDRVWGDHVFIEERTVDVHVKRLREALAPVHSAGLIETVRGAGYRLSLQPGSAAG